MEKQDILFGLHPVIEAIRSGKELDEAVEYCRQNGIEFYAVNKSYPEEEFNEAYASRKIEADIFIDDRNIGGMLGWGEIYHLINPNETPSLQWEQNSLPVKRPFLKRLFGS